jgi:spermidine synthase
LRTIAGKAGSWPPLRLLVFVVGAASLGTEIAAARLLAPYFGASTIVWANTIATVLVALSAGYWLGGRLADRAPTRTALSALVLAASVALAAVPFVARPFLGTAVVALDRYSAGAFVGSLIGVVFLVGVPVALLGAAAPYAIRLSIGDVRASGSVAGGLYALSTVGSLAGTFLAALVLVPFAGTQRTFLAFAAALAAVSAPALRRSALLVPAGIVVALVLAPVAGKGADGQGRVIDEVETPYQYARVVEAPDGTRRLELNEGVAVHSVYRPGAFLTDDYWDDFLVLPLTTRPRPPRRVAILGNAAGTTARAYGHFFPRTAVDAVELDARLTEIGRRLFGLRGPRLRVITADARPFLRSTDARYDAIFVDAYRQPYIPFYLATREFFRLTRARLAPGGVVVVNVGHVEGSAKLERVLGATMRAAFPHVWRDPAKPTNTQLVASVAPLSPARAQAAAPPPLRALADAVAGRLAPALAGGEVYTDDRAPVEWLIDRSILAFARGRGGS